MTGQVQQSVPSSVTLPIQHWYRLWGTTEPDVWRTVSLVRLLEKQQQCPSERPMDYPAFKSPSSCQCVCGLVLPNTSAEGTALLGLRCQPLGDALQVESMAANTPDHRAIISRKFAVRGTAIKRHSADSTDVVSSVPGPGCYRVPAFNVYLEGTAA